MKREEVIYCLKAQSERYSEVCEECPLYGQTGVDHCCEDALQMAIKALEEVQQYRQIGTLEECLRNKDFLDFLSDKMNPNDFEIYLRLYNALKEKGCE